MKNKKIVIFPKGIKDMGELTNSKEFKDFLNSAIKPDPEPKRTTIESLADCSVIFGGVGRSYIGEYMETLPEVTMDDIQEGKCDGHLVAILDT